LPEELAFEEAMDLS